MREKRKVYDREFKINVVKLEVSSGSTIKEVAEDLGGTVVLSIQRQ